MDASAFITGPMIILCDVTLPHAVLGNPRNNPLSIADIRKCSPVHHVVACERLLPVLTFHCVWLPVTAAEVFIDSSEDLSHITLMQGKLPGAMNIIHDANLQ